MSLRPAPFHRPTAHLLTHAPFCAPLLPARGGTTDSRAAFRASSAAAAAPILLPVHLL